MPFSGFRHYEKFPRGKKEFYLLSVFMGDIVKSKEICSQLAKRGRSCNERSSPITDVFKPSEIITDGKMERSNQTDKVSDDEGNRENISTEESHHGHNTSDHHSLAERKHVVKPRQLHHSEIHQQIHRHHVEVHYEPSSNHRGSLFGQNPAHNIHYTSRRVIDS